MVLGAGGWGPVHVQEACPPAGISLYSVGKNEYPARPDGTRQIKIRAREVNTDKLGEYTCKF